MAACPAPTYTHGNVWNLLGQLDPHLPEDRPAVGLPQRLGPLQDLLIRGEEAGVGPLPGPQPTGVEGPLAWLWGGVNK